MGRAPAGAGHLSEVQPPHFSQKERCFPEPGRPVGLAPVTLGSHVGRIGLQHQVVERHLPRQLQRSHGVVPRQGAGKGDGEAEADELPGHFP